jgi:DNA repair exonuclease SbcCD ATPase subunit
MSRKDHIIKLIHNHTRRLQKLEEKLALEGLEAPPSLLIEIEDIKEKIMELYKEFVELDKKEKDEKEEEELKLAGRLESALKDIERIVPSLVLSTLTGGLKRLADYHEILKEWKELHNLLQEIIVGFDPFVGKVDELYATNGEISETDRQQLKRLWNYVEMRIQSLTDFAKRIKRIGCVYCDDDDTNLTGEPWIIEVVSASKQLEATLEKSDRESLYDSTRDFSSVCNVQLFGADRKLRDVAEELYTLSATILGRI